jgi:ABC-type branched-subunit amino acid transport system substrate-binding protein
MKLVRIVFLSVFLLSCAAQTKRSEWQTQAGKRPLTPVNKTGKNKKAGALAGQVGDKNTLKEATAQEQTPSQKIHQLEEEGKYSEALRELVTLSVSAPNKQEQESYRLRAIEITENKLDEAALKDVSRDSDYGFIRGHALYKLGLISLDNHDKEDARKYFASVVDFLPGSDLAVRSQDILSQLEAAKYVESKTIGVVLPLSGRNAAVGQRALRGIEMGLGVNTPGSSFKLAVMDSEGNPDNARRGVERLVKEDNVIAIIGSLLSKTAPAVSAKADELGVPNIALSQKSGITDIGPNVFRNSLTSDMQVQYLVRVAMDEMGMKKFALLYPNDPYGVEYANIFWDQVLARGGEITAVQSYTNKETDFRYPIQRLVGTYYAEGRADELKIRAKEVLAAEKKKAIRHSVSSDDILPPIVDFDAIFIPDSAKTLGQISAMLAYNDVRGVKLLGTNLWNTHDIAKRAGNAASNIVFVDSYSDTIPTQEKSRFVSDYKILFSEEPSLIEIQAYDSALILRQLIVGGASTRDELSRRLLDLKKFPGALGTLNMTADREVERPLMAFTLDKGEVTPLKSRQ